MDLLRRLFRIPTRGGRKRMSSDDGQDHPPKSSGGLNNIFRNLSTSRAKPRPAAEQADGSSERSTAGLLTRTRSRGLLVDRDSAPRTSPAMSMSSHVEQPSMEKILEDVKPQIAISVRHDAVKWAASINEAKTKDQSLEILEATKDLLEPQTRPEVRLAIYSVLQSLLKQDHVQLSQVQLESLFGIVSLPSPADDLKIRLECLIELIDVSKRLELEPLHILPLLSAWTDQWYTYTTMKRQEQKEQKRTKSEGASVKSSADSSQTYSITLKSDGSQDHETFFPRLCKLVCDTLDDQTRSFKEADVAELLEQIIKVCKKTTLVSDIQNSIHVFDAVLLHTGLPKKCIGACIDVLCGTFSSVKDLRPMSFNSMCNLLKSTNQDDTLQTMFQFLACPSGPESRNLNVIRGIVHLFTSLIAARGEDELPSPDFHALVSSLHDALARDSAKLEGDILNLCNAFLDEPAVGTTLRYKWKKFFEVITMCSRRIVSAIEKTDDEGKRFQISPSRVNRHSDPLEYIASESLLIARSLESAWTQINGEQRSLASAYLTHVYRILDPSQVQLLVNYYQDEGLATHYDQWLNNAKHLVQSIYKNKENQTDSRLFALTVIQRAYMKNDSSTDFNEHRILDEIMASLKLESDESIYSATVSFLVDAADISSSQIFEEVLRCFLDCTSKPSGNRRASTPSSPTSSSAATVESITTLPNAVSNGLVQMLLRSLNTSAMKSVLAFDCLLNLARSEEASTDARITALKLLFRVRSDTNGSVYVISESESEHVAAALYRTVESEDQPTPRDGRASDRTPHTEESEFIHGLRSSVTQPQTGLSRSGTRGASTARPVKRIPPLWMYPGPKGLPEDPPSAPSLIVFSTFALAPERGENRKEDRPVALKTNQWLELVIALLQRKQEDWEVSSYVLVHLGSQLMNTCMFSGCIPQLKLLRNILCDQVINSKFSEPPKSTGLRKSDVAVCVFHAMTALVTYHKHFSKGEEDELVRSLTQGIGSGDATSRTCIHALSICCHEIPLSVTRILTPILEKMSTIITQSHLAVHILEFLAELARLPDVYINLRDELRLVFGICVRYLQTAREHRPKTGGTSSVRTSYASRHSGGVREFAPVPESPQPPIANDLPQYVYALTYHVMIFWFLSLKLQDRADHVKWITSRLVYQNEERKEVLEEQSEVFIDMMQRTAYSDLGDTFYNPEFAKPSDGPVQKKSWLVGMSILTVETAGTTGLTQITKRQASGTTHSIYQQFTADRLPHHIPLSTTIRAGTEEPVSMLPSHVLLQLTTSAFPTYVEMQPIPLPDDEATKRVIRTFDRNDIVDGHKVGIVYVNEGQTEEVDILANSSGSADYDEFLEGLGTKVPLEGAKFNTHGLDKNTDGAHTYAWRDRVTEIIFHVATMMPTNRENDLVCAQKKRHIGNDFVTIVFNESNLPYKFDTIPSQFNYVNIVITPASRLSNPLRDETSDASLHCDKTAKDTVDRSRSAFFKVQVVSKPGFPKISPASDIKLLSKESLPAFVRLISLNASVFSLVWSTRGQDDEHISSWRNRLRDIRKLRERTLENIVTKAGEAASKVESSNSRRTSTYPEGENTRMKALAASAGYPEVDNLVDVLNFSGWTE